MAMGFAEIEDVPTTWLVTGALIFFGTIFEVGYFFSIGLEFMSTVGVGDWVFSIAVMSVPIAILGTLTISLIKKLKDYNDRMDSWEPKSRLGRVIMRMPTLWWLLILTLFYGLFLKVMTVDVGFWAILGFIAAMLLTMSIWTALESGEAYLDRESAVRLILAWSSVIFMIGRYYGDLGGMVCNFNMDRGGQLTAVYMRSVSEGHLVRIGGKSYLLDRSHVDEISCDPKDNTLGERRRLGAAMNTAAP